MNTAANIISFLSNATLFVYVVRTWDQSKLIAVTVALAATSVTTNAHASLWMRPRTFLSYADRLSFDAPTLPPMAFTRFCMRHTAECEQTSARQFKNDLNEPLWTELEIVNRDINRAIIPQANDSGVLAENWLVHPNAGDCNDYAVTKRHELLRRGWPMRSLLLAEVGTLQGIHHLVLIVRMDNGDFVLDNLNPNIVGVSRSTYRWIRAQSPTRPKLWFTIKLASLH
jgi:predicted transglutaminase-like cysteine proteinase